MHSLCDGSIDEVLDFCSSEAWCHLSELFVINRLISTDFTKVQIENILPTIHIGVWHVNFLVKSTWADGCRVQRLLVICCSNNHNLVVLLKTIHFRQYLV